MRPVKKSKSEGPFAKHGDAKPLLIHQLGPYCSYCEVFLYPQQLDVEHIYPAKSHKSRRLNWDNFLLACKSCNSFKNNHLGSGPQRDLYNKYLWPHLHNTFHAFQYEQDGRVELRKGLRQKTKAAALATRSMVGLIENPSVATGYESLGIAYDGIGKRREMWSIATDTLKSYIKSPSASEATRIAKLAAKLGFFSIWMTVFRRRREMLRKLVDTFKADTSSFDSKLKPIHRRKS